MVPSKSYSLKYTNRYFSYYRFNLNELNAIATTWFLSTVCIYSVSIYLFALIQTKYSVLSFIALRHKYLTLSILYFIAPYILIFLYCDSIQYSFIALQYLVRTLTFQNSYANYLFNLSSLLPNAFKRILSMTSGAILIRLHALNLFAAIFIVLRMWTHLANASRALLYNYQCLYSFPFFLASLLRTTKRVVCFSTARTLSSAFFTQ